MHRPPDRAGGHAPPAGFIAGASIARRYGIDKRGRASARRTDIASSAAPPHVDHAARARLLGALAQGLDAGLPADRALAAAQDVATGAVAERLADAAARLARGGPLARTLARTGVLSALDTALVETAEQSGSLPRMLAGLAHRYERLHRHAGRIRARLALPIAVGVIGLLVLPLPALVRGELTPLGYLWQAVATVAACGVLLVAAARLLSALTRGAAPAFAFRLPVAGPFALLQARLAHLEQLHALLAAGVDARKATRLLRRHAAGDTAKQWFGTIERRLDAGDTLADALLASGLAASGEEHRLIATGEAAGRLEAMLSHVVERLRADLDGRVDTVAEWLPRIVYVLVVAALAGGFVLG